jgi:hypothetical protein
MRQFVNWSARAFWWDTKSSGPKAKEFRIFSYSFSAIPR